MTGTQRTLVSPDSVDSMPGDRSALLASYTTMALIRAYEDRILELRTAGEIVGPVHPYIGQEAIAVGVCEVLRADDVIVSHYRGHGHALARGVDLVGLTAELMGRRTGLCGGKAAALISDPATNVLVSSGLVGAGIPIAAGAAVTAQLRSEGGVVVVFFGDGALGSGVVHETFNIAATQRLPLVFVCEHNGYQGGTRTEEVYPDVSLVRVAEGHRIPARSLDGNDVQEVRAAAAQAVAAARSGNGPTFLEARTYLTKFHLQFDRPSTERRPESEMRHWTARDPLVLAGERLRAAGADPRELTSIRTRADETVADAVEHARAQPWPDPKEVFTHVWAEEK